MNKVAHYLQEHVQGEVIASPDARRYFSTDKSVFELMPTLIVYPRNENDVRKAARFTWQLAERNRILPITARGGGSDQSGAAIGSGIVMVFPAHMNRIVELDPKNGTVTVEPGANFGALQQTLETHGRFLPSSPGSAAYSTVGGAIANNASGANSIKYGDTRAYVKSLRVVLANGEAIVTERLTKRELSKKLGLSSFEGEIYRSLDALLEEHHEVIAGMARATSKNSAGYDLLDVKHKDGSFDLTPLFVGSQGTLGIVTEAILNTETHNPETTLLTAFFDDVQHLQSAVTELRRSRDLPSAIEMVDGNLLTLAASESPAQLKGLVENPYPKFILLVEYDDSGRIQKKNAKHGAKILERYATHVQIVAEFESQELLWKIRQLSSSALAHSSGNAKALPLVEDGAVPVEQLGAFITGIYDIFERNHMQVALWGHAGDGNLHVQPSLDLSQLGDRQRAFRVMDEYYKLVISLGGTTTGEHGDGRLRAPYLEQLYGAEAYELLRKVKKVFDPYGTMNPGVKVDVSLDDLKPLLRQGYTLDHLYRDLPRS
ncbi:MAG TPA: FAD-binding oxidoreductase [Candidatus Saccharimonadales bacterium]|nr:FAD-binding oxidoreductase [Candidatus Saccharimonadales bacterium]